jgi:hypothetical protein
MGQTATKARIYPLTTSLVSAVTKPRNPEVQKDTYIVPEPPRKRSRCQIYTNHKDVRLQSHFQPDGESRQPMLV